MSAEAPQKAQPSLAGNLDDLTALHELPVSIEPWAEPVEFHTLSARMEVSCDTGFVFFEGECVPEEKYKKEQELKDRAAILVIQTSGSPEVQAKAQVKLVEQQTAQVEKAEHDLDEIIEALEAKRAQENLKLPVDTAEREL